MIDHMNAARDQGERLATAVIEVVERARWDARIRSVRDLAIQAGMTHTYLYKRMAGKVTMTVRDLGALGAALGIEPAELVRRARALAEARDIANDRPVFEVLDESEITDIPLPSRERGRQRGHGPQG